MRLVIKTWESQKIQLKVSHSNLFKFFMFREWKKFSRASKKDENKISRGVLKMLLTHKFLNEIAMCDDRQMMMMAMGAPLLDWRWLRELWMSETSKKRKIVFSAAVCLFFSCRYSMKLSIFCCLFFALIIGTPQMEFEFQRKIDLIWSHPTHFFRCNTIIAKVSCCCRFLFDSHLD